MRSRCCSASAASRSSILGAVFLVLTGGEALYADMGHFGKKPVRLAWFALVWPGLLLNYFGQGALMLDAPTELVESVLRARAGRRAAAARAARDGARRSSRRRRRSRARSR